MIEVLKIKNILYLAFALLLAGCSGDDIAAGGSLEDKDFDPVGEPVLFSVGLEAQATTRTASNMDNGRFVCTMYYHSKPTDNDDSNYNLSTSLISTAWLEVSDGDGNVVYKNSSFNDAGTPFYWKNRLKHAFLAIADNNNLTSTTAQPIYNSDNDDYRNEYDLTTGSSIADQPDPILALTEFKPVGNAEGPVWNETAQAANRVTLNFKHQFSLIQVNVKAADTSVSLAAGQIEKVELLGVTTMGYVYTKLNENGTVNPASFKEESSNNAFKMFGITPATSGYDSSFNAIAFGKLCAIRVTWHEAVTTTIAHTSTYTLSGTGLMLVSGKRYVYNLSLSRSGLSVINASVENWGQKEGLVYDVNGTANN